ncbi:lamin-B receptor [Phlebotomus argentipes]|uniref:lamin-B receptor n=1 Tax=Phlebotomus argentipes TaxID=94469 RepID=UPI00289364B3|nr:lamin-B receptor [Phlebotomus argentipes]
MDKKRVTRGTSDSHGRKGSRYGSKKRSPSPEVIRKYPARRSPGAKRSLSPKDAKARKASKSPRRETKKPSKKEEESPKERKKGHTSPKSAEKLELKTTGSTSSVTTQSTSKTVTLSRGAEDADLKMGGKVLTVRLSQEPRTLTPASELSRRSVSRSVSQSVDRFSHTEFSDNENEYGKDTGFDFGNDLATSYVQRGKSLPADKRGSLRPSAAVLHLVFVTIFTLVLSYFCEVYNCGLREPEWSHLWNLKMSINYQLAGLFISFNVLVALLASFPLGRIVNMYTERGQNVYYFNGLGTAVVATGCVALAEYFKYRVMDLVLAHQFQLCVLSLINGLSLSLYLFFRSKKMPEFLWNPQAKTGNQLVDFMMGREVSPLWFDRIDIKLVQRRISILLTLMIAGSYFYRSVRFGMRKGMLQSDIPLVDLVLGFVDRIHYNHAIAMTSGLLVFYLLDLLLHEHHLTSSYELQYEGLGSFLLLTYSSFPFLITTIPRLVIAPSDEEIPNWFLVAVAVLFIAGVVVKRLADKFKYEFRLNPQHEKFENVEAIPTHQNKELLVSGLWGFVRHPNHLGEMISVLSFFSLLYAKFGWVPFLSGLHLVLLQLNRMRRVERHCDNRYMSSWKRYTNIVPNLIMPKVY